MRAQIRKAFILVVNYYLMCSGSYRKIFERIMISLKGTVVNHYRILFYQNKAKKALIARLNGGIKNNVYSKRPCRR